VTAILATVSPDLRSAVALAVALAVVALGLAAMFGDAGRGGRGQGRKG
jgi:hypothetical protein